MLDKSVLLELMASSFDAKKRGLTKEGTFSI